jgi:hypothetical protein
MNRSSVCERGGPKKEAKSSIIYARAFDTFGDLEHNVGLCELILSVVVCVTVE